MNEKQFIEQLKLINIFIDKRQLEQFDQYYKLLIEWNEKINLTAITDRDEVYLKHFYDSASLTKIVDLKSEKTFCDVGSGAGFPGIVLKILFPQLEVFLVDSLNKRVNFLNVVIDQLKLEKIIAIHSRIEEYALIEREKYDVVTARAVAPLNVLLECCFPMVKVGKSFIPMKGNISQEIKSSQNALKILNAEAIDVEEFRLPIEDSQRTLLKIRKNKKTDHKYPRKYSDIKKRPL